MSESASTGGKNGTTLTYILYAVLGLFSILCIVSILCNATEMFKDTFGTDGLGLWLGYLFGAGMDYYGWAVVVLHALIAVGAAYKLFLA